jgi:hypothetical protein
MDVLEELRSEGNAAAVLLSNLKDILGDDEEFIFSTVEGQTNVIAAIGNAIDRIELLRIMSEVIRERVANLLARADRFDQQADRIKIAIKAAMDQSGLRKLELPMATLSVRAIPPSVVVVEEAEIPAAYWKAQPPKLDKKELLRDLKDNKAVPGATLSNGGETLAMRML